MNVTTPPPTDRELVRAFAATRDEAAFAEIVRRHRPMVLATCRRVLADAPDADDAFQAVFLVLARRAGAVGRPDRLGGWLHGVAVRCARRARAAVARRRAKEHPMSDVAAPAAADPLWADARPVLDEEIGRLPEKVRAALVLCELEGVGRAEAAGPGRRRRCGCTWARTSPAAGSRRRPSSTRSAGRSWPTGCTSGDPDRRGRGRCGRATHPRVRGTAPTSSPDVTKGLEADGPAAVSAWGGGRR